MWFRRSRRASAHPRGRRRTRPLLLGAGQAAEVVVAAASCRVAKRSAAASAAGRARPGRRRPPWLSRRSSARSIETVTVVRSRRPGRVRSLVRRARRLVMRVINCRLDPTPDANVASSMRSQHRLLDPARRHVAAFVMPSDNCRPTPRGRQRRLVDAVARTRRLISMRRRCCLVMRSRPTLSAPIPCDAERRLVDAEPLTGSSIRRSPKASPPRGRPGTQRRNPACRRAASSRESCQRRSTRPPSSAAAATSGRAPCRGSRAFPRRDRRRAGSSSLCLNAKCDRSACRGCSRACSSSSRLQVTVMFCSLSSLCGGASRGTA